MVYVDQNKIFSLYFWQDVHIVLGDQKKKANHGSTSNILSFLKKTRR
jgi:hypothetical protein